MSDANVTREPFGTVEQLAPGKVKATGWDEHNRTFDLVFRTNNKTLQVGTTGVNGGRGFRELRAGEWATYPTWLRREVPIALGVAT